MTYAILMTFHYSNHHKMSVKATVASLLGWRTQRAKITTLECQARDSEPWWQRAYELCCFAKLFEWQVPCHIMNFHSFWFFLNSLLRQISALLWLFAGASAIIAVVTMVTGTMQLEQAAGESGWQLEILEDPARQRCLKEGIRDIRVWKNGNHPLDWLLTLAKLEARPLGFLNFVCTNPPTSSNYGNKQVDFVAIRIGSSCWAGGGYCGCCLYRAEARKALGFSGRVHGLSSLLIRIVLKSTFNAWGHSLRFAGSGAVLAVWVP